jgi:predicted kinase
MTYQTCLERAAKALFEGRRVLVDATFRAQTWRRSFLDLAAAHGVPGRLLLCRADPRTACARIAGRRDDVSDADWQVYLETSRRWEPLDSRTARRTDAITAAGPRAAMVEQALDVLRAHRLVS